VANDDHWRKSTYGRASHDVWLWGQRGERPKAKVVELAPGQWAPAYFRGQGLFSANWVVVFLKQEGGRPLLIEDRKEAMDRAMSAAIEYELREAG
jgi:hypothetical protein